MIHEWALAIAFVIGVLQTYRWLYERVAEEKVGWWDAASLVCVGPLIGRVVRFTAARFSFIPDWAPMAVSPVLSIASMYLLLRLWKELTPRQAAIVSGIWLPIILAMALVFVYLNLDLFTVAPGSRNAE